MTARDKILETAAEVFARKGYHETNVEEIVNQANTSKGGFYFHFPSKKDLFILLIDELGAKLVSKVEDAGRKEGEPLERVFVALRAGIRTFTKYPTLSRLLLIEAPVSGSEFEGHRFAVYERLSAAVAEMLREADRDSGFLHEMDADIVARAWIGATSQLIVWWLHDPDGVDLQKATKTLEDMFRTALGCSRKE